MTGFDIVADKDKPNVLPCPLCGVQPNHYMDDWGSIITCPTETCWLSKGRNQKTLKTSVEMWNTFATLTTALAAKTKELVECEEERDEIYETHNQGRKVLTREIDRADKAEARIVELEGVEELLREVNGYLLISERDSDVRIPKDWGEKTDALLKRIDDGKA